MKSSFKIIPSICLCCLFVSCEKNNNNNNSFASGPGVSSYISSSSMIVYNGKLIISAGNSINQWDGKTWSVIGNVGSNAFVIYNGNLVVGGVDSMNGISAQGIAIWNGSSWSAPTIKNELNGITALIVYKGLLIASGELNSGGKNVIAILKDSTWVTIAKVQGGVGDAYIADANVFTVYNGNLVVGGGFDTLGGIAAKNIAQWDSVSWSPLSSGTSLVVNALAVSSGNLYVLYGISVISQWNGSVWQVLTMYGSAPTALGVYNGNLVSSGNQEYNNVALFYQWNGTNWSQFGGNGVSDETPLPNEIIPDINCMITYNGNLIVGGWFQIAGGVAANNIAQWNGVSWSAL